MSPSKLEPTGKALPVGAVSTPIGSCEGSARGLGLKARGGWAGQKSGLSVGLFDFTFLVLNIF